MATYSGPSRSPGQTLSERVTSSSWPAASSQALVFALRQISFGCPYLCSGRTPGADLLQYPRSSPTALSEPAPPLQPGPDMLAQIQPPPPSDANVIRTATHPPSSPLCVAQGIAPSPFLPSLRDSARPRRAGGPQRATGHSDPARANIRVGATGGRVPEGGGGARLPPSNPRPMVEASERGTRAVCLGRWRVGDTGLEKLFKLSHARV